MFMKAEKEKLLRAYRYLEGSGFREVEYMGPSHKKGWLQFSATTSKGEVVDLSLLVGPDDHVELTIHG
jgi:hypothetical protein